MVVHAPFHPDTGQAPKQSGPAGHEPLDDVLADESSSRTQRWIGWICALLTVAAAVVVWWLL